MKKTNELKFVIKDLSKIKSIEFTEEEAKVILNWRNKWGVELLEGLLDVENLFPRRIEIERLINKLKQQIKEDK